MSGILLGSPEIELAVGRVPGVSPRLESEGEFGVGIFGVDGLDGIAED